jgi:hypothetical protein
MAERFLVVAVILVFTLAGALLVRTLVHRRLAAVVGHAVPSLLQARLSATGPTLVYFYGHNCGTCADQAHALDELTHEVPVHIDQLQALAGRETNSEILDRIRFAWDLIVPTKLV